MKAFTSVLLFSFLTAFVYGQSAKIDSLNRLLPLAKSDTAHINLLLQKTRLLDPINIDSAIALANKVVIMAKKADYRKGQIAAHHILVRDYSLQGRFDEAQNNLNGIEELIRDGSDSIAVADFYGSYGIMNGIRGEYVIAIDYVEKAVGIINRNGYTPNLMKYFGELGIGYQQIANYPKALEYQQAALALAEKKNDEIRQAYTLVNMANTYFFIGDTLRSIQSLERAIGLAKENNLKNVEVYAYSNLSNTFLMQKKWQQAEEYAMNAARIAEAMGDYAMQATSLSKVAIALAQTGQLKRAEELSKEAIRIAEATGQDYNIAQAYSSMGFVYFRQQKFREAIPYYERVIESLKKDFYNDYTATKYFELAQCYENIGSAPKALSAYKNYFQIKDSLRNQENIQKTTELTMNFEFEKKQAQARAEQDLKDAADQRIKNRQLFVILFLGFLVLSILIIVLILVKNNKQKRQANDLLHLQKSKVEEALSELKSTQAQLIQSEKMASLGELTAGIAHEIQNPLNFVNNFSEVSTDLVKEMVDEVENGNPDEVKAIARDVVQNLEKINHHGKRAADIVKGMLQHSRSSSGVKEPTDINALADEYLRLAYHGSRAKDKSFNATMKTDFDESIGKINVVPQDIGRVILNLITNAFYVVNEKSKQNVAGYEPTVSVSTRKEGNKILISVNDNGNGIPDSIIEKIFQPFFTTKPTGQGTGLGLSLSYDIVKAHGGALKVETKEKVGTIFTMEIPKVN